MLMKSNEVLVIHPKTSAQLEALKSFMAAFKIEFVVREDEEYRADFLEKIKESRNQVANGEFISLEKKDLKSYLGV